MARLWIEFSLERERLEDITPADREVIATVNRAICEALRGQDLVTGFSGGGLTVGLED